MELEQQLFLLFIVAIMTLVVMCIAWVSCICAINEVRTHIRVIIAEIRSDTRKMDRRMADRRMERLENRMDGLREEVREIKEFRRRETVKDSEKNKES